MSVLRVNRRVPRMGVRAYEHGKYRHKEVMTTWALFAVLAKAVRLSYAKNHQFSVGLSLYLLFATPVT